MTWPFTRNNPAPSIFAMDKAFNPHRAVSGKALTVVPAQKRYPAPNPAQTISLPGSLAPKARGVL
ncbi:MAG: hypothetical protein V4757_07285 [Pseudomonadota bacterium]